MVPIATGLSRDRQGAVQRVLASLALGAMDRAVIDRPQPCVPPHWKTRPRPRAACAGVVNPAAR